jgi:hypothetical protein
VGRCIENDGGGLGVEWNDGGCYSWLISFLVYYHGHQARIADWARKQQQHLDFASFFLSCFLSFFLGPLST